MNVRERNCEKKRQDIGHSELFISTIVSIKEKFRFEEEKEKKKKEGKVFRWRYPSLLTVCATRLELRQKCFLC